MRNRVMAQAELLAHIDEIEERFDAREPEVLAFVPEDGRFARLRREARVLLERYPAPGTRPLLFGMLVGVKDIFRVDGFLTHAGSKLPPDLFQGREAESVTALKNAGALVLGKTVTTEFAYFAPGPTRNPHNLEHTPGGSSSGSAAAVSAGFCSLALGTQTIGSITRPAAFCGVVGYKPSYDRISRAGVIPLSPSLDHVGAFTPDVDGARRAARVLCRDWVLVNGNSRLPVLGIPEGPYLAKASAEGLGHFHRTCQQLKTAGYTIRSISAMSDFESIRARHDLIVAAEAARVHAEWFARFGDLYHAKTADLIRRGQPVSDAELSQALAGCEKLRRELISLMDEHGIDLWISPAAPGPAPKGLESTGDPVMNLPWTRSGLPTVCLSAGKSEDGLPMGLQIAARWYADEALLAWAGDIERVVG